ncbi:hypothetical protein DRN52_01700 [Thermococci archaeon]|nr:MAG: hypothetical protein DRN52_01700 [Thermococci archaeon]
MQRSDWIAIGMFLLAVTLMALWCIDVSVSAMLNEGVVTNGFAVKDPLKTYHIGLYLIIVSTFANTLIIVHLASKIRASLE